MDSRHEPCKQGHPVMGGRREGEGEKKNDFLATGFGSVGTSGALNLGSLLRRRNTRLGSGFVKLMHADRKPWVFPSPSHPPWFISRRSGSCRLPSFSCSALLCPRVTNASCVQLRRDNEFDVSTNSALEIISPRSVGRM